MRRVTTSIFLGLLLLGVALVTDTPAQKTCRKPEGCNGTGSYCYYCEINPENGLQDCRSGATKNGSSGFGVAQGRRWKFGTRSCSTVSPGRRRGALRGSIPLELCHPGQRAPWPGCFLAGSSPAWRSV